MPAPARMILVHKQRTSAMIRFLRYGNGIIAPEPLPKLAQVVDEDDQVDEAAVVLHPAVLIKAVADTLGLQGDDIELESDFCAHVDTPDGVASVYLGALKSIDPPFDAAKRIGARFIAITEARDLPPAELKLLRSAYTCVME